jgi:hypothetical protein
MKNQKEKNIPKAKTKLAKKFPLPPSTKAKIKFTSSPKTKPLQNFVLKFPPSKIPPLCMPSPASPLSSPPLSRYPLPMAVLFLSQDDNKENIPPFFPKQATLITKSKSPLPTSNKRRVRRPLEDITTLFNREIYSTSALDNRIYIFHSLPSACKVRSGKRRAEDGVYPTCKKTTQLLHSSKNFR